MKSLSILAVFLLSSSECFAAGLPRSSPEAQGISSPAILSFIEEAGKLTSDHQERIKNAVNETPYYDLKGEPQRFYLVNTFAPTDAKKTSAGGIMGLRYLDLSRIVPAYNPRKDYTSAELAAALKGTTWE